LFVNASLHRLGQLDDDLLNDRVEDRGQVADVPVLLHTVGGGSISTHSMVRVNTDSVLHARLLPLDIHQLGLCLHRYQGEGVGAHFIVNNFLSFSADGFGDLITFFLLLDHQTILHIFFLTVSFECWDTNFSFLLHIIYAALFSVVLNTWTMRLWWGVGWWLVVGWSGLVVVNIGFG